MNISAGFLGVWGSVWLGHGRLHPLMWGKAVRCSGIHPLRNRGIRVVCIERYRHGGDRARKSPGNRPLARPILFVCSLRERLNP